MARTSISLVAAYAVLGVAPGAARADVKAAYRRLAKERHPDRFAAQARRQTAAQVAAINARFREVQTAYEVIEAAGFPAAAARAAASASAKSSTSARTSAKTSASASEDDRAWEQYVQSRAAQWRREADELRRQEAREAKAARDADEFIAAEAARIASEAALARARAEAQWRAAQTREVAEREADREFWLFVLIALLISLFTE
ncbi:MAG: J domain-containing protein [Myxococcales bacterium]|nr:J domain-containing protein [Myxococcales bacterium]